MYLPVTSSVVSPATASVALGGRSPGCHEGRTVDVRLQKLGVGFPQVALGPFDVPKLALTQACTKKEDQAKPAVRPTSPSATSEPSRVLNFGPSHLRMGGLGEVHH